MRIQGGASGILSAIDAGVLDDEGNRDDAQPGRFPRFSSADWKRRDRDARRRERDAARLAGRSPF